MVHIISKAEDTATDKVENLSHWLMVFLIHGLIAQTGVLTQRLARSVVASATDIEWNTSAY